MKRSEFLNELKEKLSFELPERMVRENVEYYDRYIKDEVKNGRSESEVLEDLGSPQLIARSVIDAATSGPDGVPGTGDDVNFREEVYGGQQTGKDRRAAADGQQKQKNNPASNGRFSVNGREFGCSGCLIALLIFSGVVMLLSSLLSSLDPGIVLLIAAIAAGFILFRKRM